MVRTFAKAGAFSRMLHASTLERIFVVREMQALFENKMLDFWLAWLGGRDFEGFWFFCSAFRRHRCMVFSLRNQWKKYRKIVRYFLLLHWKA